MSQLVFGSGQSVRQRGTEDGSAYVVVANSLISYHWTSADDTDAPDATNFADYVVGVASDGATGGAVYHVIDGGWVATGTTVANLYGG